MLKYLYLSLAVLLCTPSYASNGVEEVDTAASVTFKDRISIHTNALGWALMTPNIGLEYDLVHNKHKRMSLLVSGKYNWQMNQKYDSRYLYNVAGARAELRWYFGTRKIGDLGPEPVEAIAKMGVYFTEGDRSFYSEEAVPTRTWKSLVFNGNSRLAEEVLLNKECEVEPIPSKDTNETKAYRIVVPRPGDKPMSFDTESYEEVEPGKYRIVSVANQTFLLEKLSEIDNWERAKVRDTRGFFNKLLARRNMVTATQNPRTHRSYYVGPYAAYDKFSVKLGDTGYQGSAFGAGVALGYTTPLYLYKNGNAIDLELGTALGIASVEYDEFGYNSEDKCYTEGKEDSKILPMIADLHLSLVYRFDPIKKQGYSVDYEKLLKERFNYALRRDYLNKTRHLVIPDSLKRAYTEFNREVFAYNKKIREYNRAILKHEDADSADLLIEKAQLFDYAQVPTKLLDFGSDKLLSYKDIKSIDELGIAFLTKLSRTYKPIDNFARLYNTPGVTLVDTLMLKNYANMFSQEDSVSLPSAKKSYYEYLLNVVYAINQQAVATHNSQIFTQNDKGNKGSANSGVLSVPKFSVNMKIYEGSSSIMKGVSEFSIKSMPDFSLSMNDNVQAQNLGKVGTIKGKYGIDVDLGQNEAVASEEDDKGQKEDDKAAKRAEKEATKAAKKAAKAKAKADKKAAKEAKDKLGQPAEPATDAAATEEQKDEQTTDAAVTDEHKDEQATDAAATDEQKDEQATDDTNNKSEEE